MKYEESPEAKQAWEDRIVAELAHKGHGNDEKGVGSPITAIIVDDCDKKYRKVFDEIRRGVS